MQHLQQSCNRAATALYIFTSFTLLASKSSNACCFYQCDTISMQQLQQRCNRAATALSLSAKLCRTCSYKHVFVCRANPGTTVSLSLSLFLSLTLSDSLSHTLSLSLSLSDAGDAGRTCSYIHVFSCRANPDTTVCLGDTHTHKHTHTHTRCSPMHTHTHTHTLLQLCCISVVALMQLLYAEAVACLQYALGYRSV
jgi:hypothetical protein